MRHPNSDVLVEGEKQFLMFLDILREEEGVEISVEPLARFEPVRFDEELAGTIECAAKKRGLSALRITSGAGHDAQMLARVCKAAMIFVPSKDGLSHNPAEYTSDDQLLEGARILLDVVAERLLRTGSVR